jgi:DNA-binding NarL/FixJ family response regulator
VTDEVMTLQLLDRYDDSATILINGRRLIHEKGASTGVVLSVSFGQLWHDYSLGLLDEAEAGGSTLLRLSEEFEDDSYRLEAQLVLSRIAQLRGDLERAKAYFAAATPRRDRDDAGKTVMRMMVDVWIKEAEDDLAGAARAAEQVIFPDRAFRHRWRLQPSWLMAAARIAFHARRRPLAAEIASLATEVSRRNPHVATITAAALHAQSLTTADVSMMERAREAVQGSPRPIVRADVELDYGVLLSTASGTRRRGAAAINAAMNAYRQLGAHGEERRAERALQGVGGQRRRASGVAKRPAAGWPALTEIETRVARLVAGGYTNRGVAAELSLSPNTIGTHVRSIFAKLGVQSRVQMTRVVLENTAVTSSGDVIPRSAATGTD